MEGVGRLSAWELDVEVSTLSAAMARAADWLSSRDQVRNLEEATQQVLQRVQAAVSGEIVMQPHHFEQAADREAIGLLLNLIGEILSVDSSALQRSVSEIQTLIVCTKD